MKVDVDQPMQVPEPHAVLPLTVFDRLYDRTTFVIGWVVEGQIDSAALEGALTRVTRKWRALAGRIESVKNKETQWCLRIPIADMTQTFPTFTLTSTTSETPLSKCVPNLDETAESTPFVLCPTDATLNHLFIHDSTPLSYAAFESRVHPLTCWHLTHFPASLSEHVRAYTCVGFARCGIFDDEGASLVLHALAAEMRSAPWAVPPIPDWGVNDNPLQRALGRDARRYYLPLPGHKEYAGFSTLGFFQAYKMIFWHLWQKGTKGAEPKTQRVHRSRVQEVLEETRRGLQEKGYANLPVRDSDILFSWIIKTLCGSRDEILFRGTKDRKIHFNIFASFRHLFGTPGSSESLENYPFNASAPLPCPPITYEEACAFSLPDIARLLAVWRLTFSRRHVQSAYETLQRSVRAYPFDPTSDETLTMADLAECRFGEMDWSGIGGHVTLGMARFHLTPDDFMWTNTICILDKLSDGSVLLDTVLGGQRLSRLESKIMESRPEKVLENSAAKLQQGANEGITEHETGVSSR
ncbi:hypothetical protein APHAL10511_005621 [Amanita phalloides]|nr:hypothetical protein APHAL10511_005621 [Amanita phalloides]